MRDVIRVVLVDPKDESRQALQRLLGSMGSVWIAEVLPTYQVPASRVVEIAPDLCIVALDSEPNQAIELIASLTQAMPNAQRDRVVRHSPLRRLAQPDDVANTVEFLLSDRASGITGTVITIDAGNTA